MRTFEFTGGGSNKFWHVARDGGLLNVRWGRLGTAVLKAILDGGVDPNGATEDEIESIFYTPGSLVRRLTPENSESEC